MPRSQLPIRGQVELKLTIRADLRMSHRTLISLCAVALSVVSGVGTASAQTYSTQKPRRQFITVSVDRLYTQPLHFAEHPPQDHRFLTVPITLRGTLTF